MRRSIDPLWGVVVGVVAGLLLAALHRPQFGMWLVAGTLGIAAAARLVLRPRDIGSLAVRSRRFDVLTLLSLAVALAVLAAVSPLRA